MEVGEASVGGMSAFHSGMFGKEAEEDERKKAAEREKFLDSVKVQQKPQQQPQQQLQQQQPQQTQHEQTNIQQQPTASSDGLKIETTKMDTPVAQPWHQPEQYTGCVI